jgi:hypothetical protein
MWYLFISYVFQESLSVSHVYECIYLHGTVVREYPILWSQNGLKGMIYLLIEAEMCWVQMDDQRWGSILVLCQNVCSTVPD